MNLSLLRYRYHASPALVLSMTLLTLFARLEAQDEPAISRILERGPHHRVVEFTRTLIDTNGAPYTHVGQYTEIGNGLHYLVDGEWVESEETVEPHPRGAIAQRGLYHVLFQANLNTTGAIEIEMEHGQVLRNHPLGIYATDVSLGRSVLLGELKDSLGVLQPPNEVLYSDVFEGIQADMLYRYRKGRFEASVVLREQPLLPRDFNPESTLIELATEFLEPPRRILNDEDEPLDPDPELFERADQMIDFGDMQMVRGKAFAADTGSESGGDSAIPVVKRWVVAEGRQVLFESVRLASIAPILDGLDVQRNPLPEQAAAAGRRKLPSVPGRLTDSEPMLLAGDRAVSLGLVLDYTLVVSKPQTSFHSGPTFVINNGVALSDWTWIQTGAIIKFAPNSAMAITGYLLTPGAYSSRAILTSKDDDSVGEPIGVNPPVQQSHTAMYLYAAQPVSDLTTHYPGKVQRLDIRYAEEGVLDYTPYADHEIWNCRFEDCLLGVSAAYMTVRINDVVFCKMTPYPDSGRWYQAGPGGTIIPGDIPDDITPDCSGFPAPFIDAQPVGGTVNAGTSKSFTVVAEGKCLLYQWYFNGVSIAGANAPSYTLNPVQLAHAGQYHVVVRNDRAFVTSDRVTLTVNNSPPQIYQQPFSQKIRTGGTVRFAVGAAGQAPLTYQWYRGSTLLSGKTAYDLVITSVNSTHAGSYKVRVTNNSNPPVWVDSQLATLTVLGAGASVTYDVNQDFAKGILINLNYTTVANELQINANPTPLPFVNVPCSRRGTLARIDANTGQVVGEYATAHMLQGGTSPDPSRTAVDRGGNVWVANREGRSVVKIGVIIGGIRGNKKPDGTLDPHPDGLYLGPPFIYNTCRDRHGATVTSGPDGLIKTSRKLTDVYNWVWNGTENKPEDEAVLFKVDWAPNMPRLVAVDKDDNLWIGGGENYWVPNQPHRKFDSFTGQPVGDPFDHADYGGYGGLIDGYGYLWSAGGGGDSTPGLLRVNVNGSPAFAFIGNQYGNYGIAIDPKTQRVWYGNRYPGLAQMAVYKSNDPLGSTYAIHAYPSGKARGIVVDNSNNVWVAHSSDASDGSATDVGHLRTDGIFVGKVDLMFVPPVDSAPASCVPTGLAVDCNGKIWVANLETHNAMRINPNAGPQGKQLYPIGAVDLTVDLGTGAQHLGVWADRRADPYAYSDMTGFVTLGSTFSSGSWTFVHDEGMTRAWSRLTWSNYTPTYTYMAVHARAADLVTDLPNFPFQTVLYNQPMTGISGRYLEVRVTLHRQALNTATPRLYSLTVHAP